MDFSSVVLKEILWELELAAKMEFPLVVEKEIVTVALSDAPLVGERAA